MVNHNIIAQQVQLLRQWDCIQYGVLRFILQSIALGAITKMISIDKILVLQPKYVLKLPQVDTVLQTK